MLLFVCCPLKILCKTINLPQVHYWHNALTDIVVIAYPGAINHTRERSIETLSDTVFHVLHRSFMFHCMESKMKQRTCYNAAN